MRWIQEWRDPLPPAIRTVGMVVQRLLVAQPLLDIPVVVVFHLAVEHFPETSLRVQITGIDARTPVIARFGHHVLQAGLLLELLQALGFFERHARGYSA